VTCLRVSLLHTHTHTHTHTRFAISMDQMATPPTNFAATIIATPTFRATPPPTPASSAHPVALGYPTCVSFHLLPPLLPRGVPGSCSAAGTVCGVAGGGVCAARIGEKVRVGVGWQGSVNAAR
jgi:hypothetical protein